MRLSVTSAVVGAVVVTIAFSAGLASADKNRRELEEKIRDIGTVQYLAGHVEEFRDVYESKMVPIGAIVAWYKTEANRRGIERPSGWIECSGGTVKSGPLKGMAIPNLNGERRFLRGGTTSGDPEVASVGKHQHEVDIARAGGTGFTAHNNGQGFGENRGLFYWCHSNHGALHTKDNTTHDDTRPINMSVVWIMRIE